MNKLNKSTYKSAKYFVKKNESARHQLGLLIILFQFCIEYSLTNISHKFDAANCSVSNV